MIEPVRFRYEARIDESASPTYPPARNFFPAIIERAEREREEGRDARKEQCRADHLRVGGIHDRHQK